MNEPKVPDSETDWRSVDIFLFSNGQKQTPPRKYHLTSEYLSRWSSTLMNLAHEQYGSIFSSLDLYTLEGQRVQTPMQISNGNAYVAVLPQETFIPAGYEDYLLRASRSREKRQNKSQNSAQDELDSKTQTTEVECKEEVENVEILNEEIKNTATSAFEDQTDITPIEQPQYTTKTNNTIKQSEKLSSNQNLTMLRKQSSPNPQPMIRKTSMKLKDNPVRKNLKVNTTKGTNNGTTIVTNSNNQLKPNTKSLNKTGKGIDRESILRNSIDRSKIEKKIEPRISIAGKPISSTEKTVTTDNIALENVIDDNELIVVKKQESETRSMMYPEQDKSGFVYTPRSTRLSSVVPILMPIDESKVLSTTKEEPPITVINNLIENVYKPITDVPNDDNTSKNQSKLQIDDKVQEQNEDQIILSQKPPIDSFIAVIDKGDVVNLNLKIEVRKCEGVISAQDSKHINSTTEKGSEVNISQEKVEFIKNKSRDSKQINSITEKYSQIIMDQEIGKSLEERSNLTNKPTDNEDNPKIVVIQCTCCQNLNDLLHKIDTETEKFDDKKYVVVLPDTQCDQSNERNKCTREESCGTAKSINETRDSVINPVKKVFATTSVQRLKNLKASEDASTVLNLNSEQNVSSIQKIYPANYTVIENAQKTFVDKSAQTEWLILLLEARQHDDGRYSFYLPPLHVLKHYGL